MYYDAHFQMITNKERLLSKGLPLDTDVLKRVSVYPLIYDTPTYDSVYESLHPNTPHLNETADAFIQDYAVVVVPLSEAKRIKLKAIDSATSAAIRAGFEYTVDGVVYHFSYDTFDQQNFADTANVCILKLQGVTGLPDTVTWNVYTVPDGELVRLTFDAASFLTLYTNGAMLHKNSTMQAGGVRKAAVEAATTVDEVKAIEVKYTFPR